MTDLTVANTIRAQLGGNRFTAMTGAKNFLGDDKSLTFRLPRANKGIRVVRITLNGKDLYDVEFGKIHKYEWKVISKHEDIYVDGLRELFETETGLYTSL